MTTTKKTKFNVEVVVGSTVQTEVAYAVNADVLLTKLRTAFNQKYKMLPGDRGLKITISPFVDAAKSVLHNFENHKTLGSGEAEGIAIAKMAKLQEQRLELLPQTKHATRTAKPLSPNAGGKFKTVQNRSNTDARKKNNGANQTQTIPLAVEIDLLLEGIENLPEVDIKVAGDYLLVENNESEGSNRIVARTKFAVEKHKWLGERLAETTDKQYVIVQDGKVVWATN